MDLRAPIAGMSLTKEPGNAPWEQPPLYNTPEEALGFYFQKLENGEIVDDLMFSLEQEFPLEVLVDSMTSVGVMEGYHSVDVKTLISPVLHEHLKTLAETLDVVFIEFAGPSKEEKLKEKDKKRTIIMLEKSLGGPPTKITPEVQAQAKEEMAETPLQDNPAEEAMEGPSMEASPLIKRRV